jgi:molybdenum cofactor synthesis domain-containing protein
LAGPAAKLPEKAAGQWLIRQQNPVTSRACLGNVQGEGERESRFQGEVMSEIVTAGILVIGDEILSGRTKDKNIGFIAEYLTNIGIDLKEVRVVADDEADIVAALDALRGRYTYVFTTGGIGPTHDDITADSVAKAFGVGIDHHPEVVARFKERFKNPGELNEARLRMARIPDGAELIQSATIMAPGFKIGNVIVMAGVPSIMQAMMDIVAPKLKSGVKILSDSVRANAREGDIGGPLREIANAHPDTIIGSYPFLDENQKPNTNLVVRSRDPDKLNAAMTAVKEMLSGLGLNR